MFGIVFIKSSDAMKYQFRFLVILLLCATTFGNQPECPIGFKKFPGDLCWKVKPPETFFDKYSNCQGNRVPLNMTDLFQDVLLHNEVELEDNIFWTDYVRPYDGGPFINWKVDIDGGMGLPNPAINVTLYDPSHLCLGIRIRSGRYVSMNCSHTAFRLCVVEILDTMSGHEHLGCSSVDRGFAAPVPTCVFASVLSQSSRNVAARLNFNQAYENCSRNDAHLLHKGYIYANNLRMNTSLVPLGIKRLGNDFFWMDMDEKISMDDWNFSPGEDFNEDLPNVMLDSFSRWKLTDAGHIYNDVLCENFVEIPTPKLELYQRDEILLLSTDIKVDHLRCFTDSITYYPTDVAIYEYGNDEYLVGATRSGYYWCLVVNNTLYNPSKSQRILYQRYDYVYDEYSVVIRIGNDRLPNKDLLREIQNDINYYIASMLNNSLTTTENPSTFTYNTTVETTSTTEGTTEHTTERTTERTTEGTTDRTTVDTTEDTTESTTEGTTEDTFGSTTKGTSVDTTETTVDTTMGTTEGTAGSATTTVGTTEVTYLTDGTSETAGSTTYQTTDGTSIIMDDSTFSTTADFPIGVRTVNIEKKRKKPLFKLINSRMIRLEMDNEPLKNMTFKKVQNNVFEMIMLLTADLIKYRRDEVENIIIKNLPVRLNNFDFIHLRSKSECTEQEFYLNATDVTFRRFQINETVLLDNCTAFICTGDYDVGLYWEKLYDLDDCSTTTDITTDTQTDSTTEIIVTTTKKPSEQVTDLADSLQQIANSTSINTTQLQTISNEINKVLDFGQDVEIPRTILEDLDTIIKKLELPATESQVKIVRPNIAILVAESIGPTPVIGITVNRIGEGFVDDSVNTYNSDEVNQVLSNTSGIDLIVNIESVTVTKEARLSFIVFKNDNAFSHNTVDSLQSINSRVLSVTIGNESAVFENNEHIDIHLRPYKGKLTRNESKSCVFWDFELGTNGNWSNEGCHLLKKSTIDQFDTCRCTHLTHFAEIIRFNGKVGDIDEVILSIISYVGCSLSLIGLFIIALTGTLFKTWRSEFSNKIWMHLSGAVGILMLSFLVISIVQFDEQNKAACVVFGVTLHYSLLASFCWMLISAILSYQRLVTVFSRNTSHRLLKSCLFGWLTPLLPIIILFSANSNPYPGNWEVPNIQRKFCFPDTLGFWLAIFMPVTLVVIVNTFLFIMIIYSVFISRSIQRHGDTKQIYRSLTVSFLLFFLFGLSWIFGLFVDHIVLTYLFCITATLQGFILFVFFILGNKKTREMWCVSLGRNKRTRIVTSSISTSKKSFSNEKNLPLKNVNKPRSMLGNNNNFDSRFS